MPALNPNSPAEISALLAELGLTLKKRWGQNFLVNQAARERLVSLLQPGAREIVWEIGAGLGSMTEILLPRAERLVAFEVDWGLCRYLGDRFRSEPRLTLVCGDFLETWERAVRDHGRPNRILGNLPYSSASLMVAQILESGIRPERILVTVQRELAERMASPPSTKSYSAFSILCQVCCEVIIRGELNPGSFYPPPNVVSAIVELRPREDAPSGPVLGLLSQLTRAFFASRRKTLRNNAGRLGLDAERVLGALDALGLSRGSRAEELSPADYVRLAASLTGSAFP